MIEYLRGVLLEREDDHVVIEAGGVGYGLSVPTTTAARLGDPGAETALWVLTYVREDTLKLFGFYTRHEREVFEIFLSLPGIGPSTGLAILSTLSIGEIVQATMAGNVDRFRQVKGVGPKLAEKLLIELKGRVKRLSAALPAEEMQEALTPERPLPSESARDAAAALEALDVRPAQARRAIELALESLGPGASVQALVREGLKYRR